MKLKRLTVKLLPGIDQPFEIDAGEAGFQVVFGPNGIGKSSLCRAVEGLYWENRGPSKQTLVTGEFELEGKFWRAERDGSRVRWQHRGEESEPPTLPASHNHRYFFLRLWDLIDPSAEGTHDIAAKIRRQMWGGLDLNQITSDLFADISERHVKTKFKTFNEASQAVKKAEANQNKLLRRSEQLDTLQKQLDSAKESEQRLIQIKSALRLADRREEYNKVEKVIADLPESLANLTGKENDELEELNDEINEKTERIRSVKEQLKAADDAKNDSRLDAPLDEALLKIWQKNEDELKGVELELDRAKSEHRVCQKKQDAALLACGGGNIDETALDLADHEKLFKFLRAAEAHRSKVIARKDRLQVLTHVDQTGESPLTLETSRNAADALRSWLRASEPEILSDIKRTRRSWILLAIAMTVVGVSFAVFVDPLFALLAAAGLGVAVPTFTLQSPTTSSGARVTAKDAFAKLGIKELDVWDISSVESRLRDLEGEIAKGDSRIQRARDRDVEQHNLRSELAGLTKKGTTLEERRRKLAESIKIDTIPHDAELVDFAHALDQLRVARIEAAGALGKVEDRKQKHASLLSSLAKFLEQFGDVRPKDAKEASAHLGNLVDRNRRLIEALSNKERASKQLENDSADREHAVNKVKKLYAHVSLKKDDLPGLREMLSALPNYNKLNEEATRLKSQMESDCQALRDAGHDELVKRDRLSLEKLQAKLSQSSATGAYLQEKITTIKIDVNRAKDGSGLQDLIATQEKTRTTLSDCRDEVLYTKAGKFLIEAVDAEYRQRQIPLVFERAQRHFSNFTHHKYEIHLSREATNPQFFVKELRSGETLKPDQLSDGTRTQLLLASHIAFAEEVEQNSKLPLFLDEALDQSDPERFQAIVQSLGRIANDQERQIFYLTSDPSDVKRIENALDKEGYKIAAKIDLNLVRKNAASVGDTDSLHVPPLQKVPAPQGYSTEEYGVALGVPFFQPARGFAEQHLIYILPDVLKLLHGLLATGIERVGQWKTFCNSELAEKHCSGTTSSREVTARIELLELFCELWKQGRGKTLSREALEESGALTERYLDQVVTIADEQDRDPVRVLVFLRKEQGKDPRIKNFREASIEKLEQYLLDKGFIDKQTKLSEKDLRLKGLASPAANKLPDGHAEFLLHSWCTLFRKATAPDL